METEATVGEDEQAEQRGFQGSENTVCDVRMLDITMDTFVQTHGMYQGSPKVNPEVRCGLCVIMMCQCWFILGKKKNVPFQ